MADAKHTPGPWHGEHTNSAKLSLVVVAANQGDNGSTVVIGQCAGPDREANARLIASAPDLLAELIEARDVLRKVAANRRAIGPIATLAQAQAFKASAAIAKATGAA